VQKTGLLLLIVGLTVGCASETTEPIDELENDVGGTEGVAEMFRGKTESEIRSKLDEYGIGYVVAELVTDCPKNFPSSDRNAWHNVTGEFYYIDGSGRPSRAYTDLPPVTAEARNDSCQASVGQWGDAENPSNDYDGGHLIGSQLGGWGKRANLVPQDLNFNRGNWAVLENKTALCRALPSKRMHYYISAGYPNSSALIPSTMGMQLTNNSSGAGVTLSFSNTDAGGSNGTNEKNRGVSFLTAQGCN
jgi:hypothetical protein